MKTVAVSIGNSDDKLTQQQWSYYCIELKDLAKSYGHQIHCVGYTAPISSYQSMSIIFEIRDDLIPTLRKKLALLARGYKQDAIAFMVCDETEMINAEGTTQGTGHQPA